MLDGKFVEAAIMAVSFIVLCASYLIIVWKDHSWINWATPAFFFSLGGRYVFQFAYLCMVNAGGSRYAYLICYTAYTLPFLVGALVYAFVRPIKLRSTSLLSADVAFWPWLLLAIGFLLYLPVLVEFRAYLSTPRHIYAMTRTGYGIWTYGSTFFINVGLILYFFKRHKSIVGALCFYALAGWLIYMHGTKGQILNCFLMWVLYRVYVERKVIRAALAGILLTTASMLVLGSFALFSNSSDIADLLHSVVGFADYVRLAMLIVDDEQGQTYYGRLTMENEIYARIPRVLMPDKPKDFGPFLLGKIYNPANYRADQGTGAVDFGEDYADFGPYAVLVRCATSACMGWMVSTVAFYLRAKRSPNAFMIFLFLAGLSVIPLSGPFLLPEYMVLAVCVSLLMRVRLICPSPPRGLEASTI